MTDSAHSLIIVSDFGETDIAAELSQTTGLTRIGVWELCIKSVTFNKVAIDSHCRVYSLECDLVRQTQISRDPEGSRKEIYRPAVLETFCVQPNTPVTLFQGISNVWHEVNSASTRVSFTLRNSLDGKIVSSIKEDFQIVIHMLFRRKK